MDNVEKPGNNGVSFKIYLRSVCFRKHSKAQPSSHHIYWQARLRQHWHVCGGVWSVECMWRAAEEKMVAIVEIVLKSRYFLITRAVHNDCSGACTIYKDYVFLCVHFPDDKK